ncbi:hypothetical protein Tco_0538642 [Tanacetum coccineum]
MMLIRELEALGERGVAVDSLESLKQTHARETAKLTALTDAIAESLAGIHKIDCFGSSSIPKLFNVRSINSGTYSESIVDGECRDKVHYLMKLCILFTLFQTSDHVVLIDKL